MTEKRGTTFCEILRQERKRRGWSQRDVAEKVETDFNTVSRWERGLNVPGPYFIQKLCDIFAQTPEAFGLFHEPLAQTSTGVDEQRASSSATLPSSSPSNLSCHAQADKEPAHGFFPRKEPDGEKTMQPSLPTGTVTLLFTDIEGSTRLLQQLDKQYSRVLAQCRSLLRTVFQTYDGSEVDTQGDAFFAAFARGTDAVSAAVDAQRALTAYAWPAEVTVRVRMGLHTGEPQLSAEGYVGLDVHRAARIMHAGHGGQVLLSQTTRALVEHDLPEGVSLQDLGAHRLKDLQQKSHLFQLVIAGLPADFPPLKTLDTHPNNLPVQLTSLRRARLERRWSQAELAERVGVSHETISRWENGVSKPQPLELRKLCEVFENTAEALGYPLEPLEKVSGGEDRRSLMQSREAAHDASAPPPVVAASLSPVEQQNRTRLIKRVRATWIEGVLEHSLHQEALIALDLQEQPDALANAWQLEVQETNSPPRPLPAGISIAQVYDEAEGELLILGEPGAGKTTLLLQLARALLERAEHKERERLPVIFHLSSWAQKRLPLSEWLVEELQSKYQVPQKVGQAWIEADQVLPLLDGLDEVAQEAREDCIEAINTYRRLRLERGSVPLVVCCRSQEYLTLSTRLALQQAVSIQPLTNEQIEQYLQSAGGQLEALRQALQEDPVLDDLVHRPLMLSVFTLAYQGVALQDLPTGETREATPRRVFAAYVERMLARRGVSKRFPREQTWQWLTFLAAQMQQHDQTALYLEYLQPDWLVDRQKRRLYQLLYASIVGLGSGLLVGLGSGLVFGLTRDLSFGLVDGLDSGLCFGLGSGLVGWLLGSFSASQCAERLHLKPNQGIWRSARNGLVVGLGVGLIVGLGSSLVNVLVRALVGTLNDPLLARLTNPLRVGLFFGSSFGLPAGIGIGLFGPGRQIEPQEVLTWSWRKQRSATRLLWGVGGGLLTGLFIWLDVGLFWRASSAPFWWLVGGLVGELVFGLVGGLSTNQLDEHLRLKPNQGIWHSARNGLVVGLILGLVIGLAWGVASALSGEFTFGPVAWLVFCLVRGPAFGLFLGLLFFGLDALLQHFTLRFLLWRTGCLPWNLVAFLDEAAERLLLRKVGGGYIFIHRLLLDYFAALEKKEF